MELFRSSTDPGAADTWGAGPADRIDLLRLLLVEDHAPLAEALAEALHRAGFAVDRAADAAAARELVAVGGHDLALLDLGLPDDDGLALLAEWRGRRAFPVIVLTARGGLDDRLAGLDGGADDYVVKPVETAELVARCRAVLRRPGGRLGAVLSAGTLALDTTTREASLAEAPLVLGRRETGVLEQLLRRKGRVAPRRVLEAALYGVDDEVSPNALEAAVSRLRRALEASGAPVEIRTIRGVGWMLAEMGARSRAGRPMRPMTLAARLTRRLTAVAAAVLVVTVAIVGLYYTHDPGYLRDAAVERQMARLEAALAPGPDGTPVLDPALRTLFLRHPEPMGSRCWTGWARCSTAPTSTCSRRRRARPGCSPRNGSRARRMRRGPSSRPTASAARSAICGWSSSRRPTRRTSSAARCCTSSGHALIPLVPAALILLAANALMVRRSLAPLGRAAAWRGASGPGPPCRPPRRRMRRPRSPTSSRPPGAPCTGSRRRMRANGDARPRRRMRCARRSPC